MRVAIIGSRSLNVDIEKYIPEGTTEIVSGGVRGIDTLAEDWADRNGIPKLIIRPEYQMYCTPEPLRRNELVVISADMVVAIWDGRSSGTRQAVDYARKVGKRVEVYVV